MIPVIMNKYCTEEYSFSTSSHLNFYVSTLPQSSQTTMIGEPVCSRCIDEISCTIIGVLVNTNPGVVLRVKHDRIPSHHSDFSQCRKAAVTGIAGIDPLPSSTVIEVLQKLGVYSKTSLL